MTNKEIQERIKKTIDQFYNLCFIREHREKYKDWELHYIGGVLQTALHLLPYNQYDELKFYIYDAYGYDPGGCSPDYQLEFKDLKVEGGKNNGK